MLPIGLGRVISILGSLCVFVCLEKEREGKEEGRGEKEEAGGGRHG